MHSGRLQQNPECLGAGIIEQHMCPREYSPLPCAAAGRRLLLGAAVRYERKSALTLRPRCLEQTRSRFRRRLELCSRELERRQADEPNRAMLTEQST